MYARVVTNQIQPGKMEDWAATIRDAVVPALKELKGFKGFVALLDPSTNKSIGYSMWESEADLKAGENNGSYQKKIAKLVGVLAGSPVREVYELRVLT
jgi:heme-degrading monooxygenase HmoA